MYKQPTKKELAEKFIGRCKYEFFLSEDSINTILSIGIDELAKIEDSIQDTIDEAERWGRGGTY